MIGRSFSCAMHKQVSKSREAVKSRHGKQSCRCDKKWHVVSCCVLFWIIDMNRCEMWIYICEYTILISHHCMQLAYPLSFCCANEHLAYVFAALFAKVIQTMWQFTTGLALHQPTLSCWMMRRQACSLKLSSNHFQCRPRLSLPMQNLKRLGGQLFE